MQVYFNSYINNYTNNSKPAFKGCNIPYEVEEIIVKRTPEKYQKKVVSEITSIMTEFDNKKVMLDFMTDPTGKHIEGAVYDGHSYYEHFKESWFSELFKSPVNFVKKLAKIGRKVENMNNAKEELDNAIKTPLSTQKLESYKI
jgi:hypothetical protein